MLVRSTQWVLLGSQDFPSELKQISSPIVAASVEAYNRISEELLPTPARSHYTFNLRDLSKVFQVSQAAICTYLSVCSCSHPCTSRGHCLPLLWLGACTSGRTP
jgi:hypothetical protein